MSRDDRGAVTPFVASGLVLTVVVALLVAVVGGALLTQRRAQSAADLAALAAATAVQHGRHACLAAASSADRNGADLVDCEVVGDAVTVLVARVAPRMFGRELVVRARARAGPR